MTEERRLYRAEGILPEGQTVLLYKGDMTRTTAEDLLTTAATAFQNGSNAYLNLYGTVVNVGKFAVIRITEIEK